MPGPNSVGSMRWSVQYQTRSATLDAYRQPSTSGAWTTQLTLRGELRSPGGRELLNAGQLKAVVSHAVETRWPGRAFDVKGRLLVDGKALQIAASYDPDGRRRRLVTLCTETAS